MPPVLRPLLLLAIALLSAACADVLVPSPFRYGALEVRTTLRNGTPVANADVAVYTGTRVLYRARSDSQGLITFDLLPTGPLGVQVTPPAGFRHLDIANGWTQTIQAAEAERYTLTFPLFREGRGVLRVEVVDNTGAPLDSVRVQVYTPTSVLADWSTGVQHPAVRTFADLPTGDYGVFVLAGRGYLLPDNAPVYTVDSLLIEDGDTIVARIALAPCRGGVAATVRTAAGRPLAGVPLRLYTGQAVISDAVSDADGTARWPGVACDDYGVTVTSLPVGIATPDDPSTLVADGLRLGTHATTVNGALTLATCTGTLRVITRDEAGTPVAGSTLAFFDANSTLQVSNTTASGTVELVVPTAVCRTLGVALAPPPGYRVTEGRGTSYLDGIALRDDEVRTVIFTLQRTS